MNDVVAGKGRWSKMMSMIMEDQVSLYNRALKSALRAAIREAADHTVVDSGNAVYHWQITPSTARPGNRRLGTVRDLRATRKGGRKNSFVGGRGDADYGINNRPAAQGAMIAREEAALFKSIQGREVARSYTLYHGALSGRTEPGINAGDYDENANLTRAAEAGAAEFAKAAAKYFRQGQVRKVYK